MSDINEMNVGVRWYVAHTYSGYENKVKASLEKIVENRGLGHLIFDIKIPVEIIVEKNGEETKEKESKLFPCYVLVKMRYTDNLWHTIVNTRGVTGFCGPAGRPLALTEDEIKRMRLEKINVDLKVNIGDKVKIISGPLADFVGDVQEVDAENQKCKVTVSMFGRPTPVEVDFDQIEIV